ADRVLPSVSCVDRVTFVGCALCEQDGKCVEEGGSGRRVRAQLLDLRLQLFHAAERQRDVGVAALELFGERQQRFHVPPDHPVRRAKSVSCSRFAAVKTTPTRWGETQSAFRSQTRTPED